MVKFRFQDLGYGKWRFRLLTNFLTSLMLSIRDGFIGFQSSFVGRAVKQIEPRLLDVRVSEEEITVSLADGRTISVPLTWSWRLSEASQKERQNFQIIGDVQGIHWPDVDEDISVEGMLGGVPARRA